MNEFMLVADKLAMSNLVTKQGGPFGAVVVKDGVIVGYGNNNVLSQKDPTAHAEMQAIRDACKRLDTHDLTGCVLYTSCYPCPMCLSAIIWANIKTVYYGNTKKDAADIGFRDDYIYEYIHSLVEDNIGLQQENTLSLVPKDRDDTIKTFNLFAQDKSKQLY